MKVQVKYMFLSMQIFFLLLPVGFSSCLFYRENYADFSVPQEVIEASETSEVYLSYMTLAGLEVHEVISKGELEKGLLLPAKKNLPFPLLLYVKGKSLEVYGAIFPYTKQVSKKGELAASVLQGLYAGAEKSDVQTFSKVQEYLAYFNWQKFIKECEALEEPDKVDRQKIMEDIAAGTFSKSSLIY